MMPRDAAGDRSLQQRQRDALRVDQNRAGGNRHHRDGLTARQEGERPDRASTQPQRPREVHHLAFDGDLAPRRHLTDTPRYAGQDDPRAIRRLGDDLIGAHTVARLDERRQPRWRWSPACQLRGGEQRPSQWIIERPGRHRAPPIPSAFRHSRSRAIRSSVAVGRSSGRPRASMISPKRPALDRLARARLLPWPQAHIHPRRWIEREQRAAAMRYGQARQRASGDLDVIFLAVFIFQERAHRWLPVLRPARHRDRRAEQ